MAEETNFTLKIITPDRVFYEDDAVTMVEFNTTEGEIGIYKKHVPTTVIIKPGILTITKDDEIKEAALHAGFAEILEDKVTILAEIVEWPEEIDEARAEAAKRRAEERIGSHAADMDVTRAEIALQRALTRIEILK
ncbi:MAG: ATP synthase F1 subunit epsilon [Lachnospiraceae bacterium]|nr:ATP synthase F1 subunit epsilon [Lachnospiraceae bacterium]